MTSKKPKGRSWRRFVAGWPLDRIAVAVVVGVGAGSTAADAHDVVIRSQPARNANVAAGEVTVEIEYSGRIDAPRSHLRLIAPGGRDRELTLVSSDRPNVIRADAGRLSPGDYTVRWSVLSSDGHITRGVIPFRVIER